MQKILKCCSRKGRLENDVPQVMIDSQIVEEEDLYDLAESKSIPREKPQVSIIKDQAPITESKQQNLFNRSQLLVEKNLKDLGLEDVNEESKQLNQSQKRQEEKKIVGIEDDLDNEEIQQNKDTSAFLTMSLAKSLDIPLSSLDSKIQVQSREPSVIESTLYLSTVSKNMESSQVQKNEPNSRKTNPFSRNASMIKNSNIMINQSTNMSKQIAFKDNSINPVQLSMQNSFKSIQPVEVVFAERYGLKVTEKDLNELKIGGTNLGPVLNFYLRYLEEKATRGILVSKMQQLKAVGSDFYRSFVLEKNWKHATKHFRQHDDPLISQFERIIFLVHVKTTDRWYLAVYNRTLKTMSIMTPEEKKKQLTPTIREVLNWGEKREVVDGLLKFFDQDYVEKMSKPLAASAIAENYLTDLPLCTKPENYGFHVLEMMRRVFYNYELNTDFSAETAEKFKLRFCEFIGFFGKQPDGAGLLADPFI